MSAEISARKITEGLAENSEEMESVIKSGNITIVEARDKKLNGKSFGFTF